MSKEKTSSLLPADAAQRTILSRAQQLEPVALPLGAAQHRVLRAAALADADSPPFDASAMDGYAARRVDLGQPLRVVGEAPAGGVFTGTIGSGECVRIFTGGPVPTGADCVVKQEDVKRDGDTIRAQARETSSFIRRRGENRKRGDVVVPAGTRLGPAELAALAGVGIAEPVVTRAPRCVHLVTGNELVAPNQAPTGAQIRDCNSTLIAALLAQHHAVLAGHARVRDDLDAAKSVAASWPAYDVLLISGGAGAGDHDFARPLLKALGFELHFEQVNVRPGKPLIFASRGAQLAFTLPGNPVSHWVTFHLFVAPLLRKLETGLDLLSPRLSGRLALGSKLPAPDARKTFWPARAAIANGGYELTPLPLASSGDGGGLVGANALLPLAASNPDPTQPVEFIDCS